MHIINKYLTMQAKELENYTWENSTVFINKHNMYLCSHLTAQAGVV